MTARVLFAALLALTLAGCGGSWSVCGQFDMPDYCKLPKSQSTTLTLTNACPYPVTVGTGGDALPSPATGGPRLQSGETATFSLARRSGRPWSAVLFPAGQARASRARLTLGDTDSYALKNDPALPMRVQPASQSCAAADAEHPGPLACRGRSTDYTITFCSAPGTGN